MAQFNSCDVCDAKVPANSFNRTIEVEDKDFSYTFEIQGKCKDEKKSESYYRMDLCNSCYDDLLKKALGKKPAASKKNEVIG